MSDTANIISVEFGEFDTTTIHSAWQIDYGRKLQFTDLTLPSTFEVHMCNTGDASAKRALGEDGIVELYDEYFEDGRDIDVYIYLHPTDGSGVTTKHVIIAVNQRPPYTPAEPTPEQQDIIEQAIEALENASLEHITFTDDGDGNITITITRDGDVNG